MSVLLHCRVEEGIRVLVATKGLGAVVGHKLVWLKRILAIQFYGPT